MQNMQNLILGLYTFLPQKSLHILNHKLNLLLLLKLIHQNIKNNAHDADQDDEEEGCAQYAPIDELA